MGSEVTLKIHHGTGRLTGVSLCRSCYHSLVRVDKQGEQIYCQQLGHPGNQLRSDVLDCNKYYSSALPSLHDMQQVAWTLRTDKAGKAIGFKAPKAAELDIEPDRW